MTENDRDFLARREREEKAAATAATSRDAAHVHARMAAEYGRRLAAAPPASIAS